MKIIIIGAGFTGTQLAKLLVNGKNDVVLIESNEELARHVSSRIDCEVITANGNNLSVLEDAGIATANALICVTSSDEVNMITCSLVDSVYPDILKIARVRNYSYYAETANASKKHAQTLKETRRPLYGIDFMVHPDIVAAQAIVNSVEKGSVTDSTQFDNSPYELIRIQIEAGSRFDGIAIENIRKTTDKKFLLAFIEKNGESTLPSGKTILHAGDSLGIIMERKNLPEFLELCGSKAKDISKIVLVGAGRIGTLVAENLINKKTTQKFDFLGKIFRKNRIAQKFVIIDSDEARAKEAEERFKDAYVFQADISDESFIEEEHLNEYDLVICTTGNYEMNIVTAAYLESLGLKASIVLVASGTYGDMARKIGIEVAVPIRDTVIDIIMGHLKGDAVTGVHSVNGGALEIVEITILENSKCGGKMLKDISEPGKFLILMGKKPSEASFSILTGNSVLESGDNIIVITTKEDNQHVLEKFSASS